MKEEELKIIGKGLKNRLLISIIGCSVAFGILFFVGKFNSVMFLLIIEMILGVSISLYFLEVKNNLSIAQIIGNCYTITFILTISFLIPPFRYESIFLLQGCIIALIYNPFKKGQNWFFHIFTFLAIANQIFESFFTEGNKEIDLFNEIVLVFGLLYMIPPIFIVNKAYAKIVEKSLDKQKDIEVKNKIIKKSNEKLKRYIKSNLQLENFVHLASHEMQTPLHNILNFSGLIKKRSSHKLNKAENEYVDFVISGAEEIRERVDLLVDYSFVSKQLLNYTSFSPELLIQRIEGTLISNGIIRIHNLPDTIIADYVMIKDIFRNLIANAVMFKSDERQLEIDINCEDRTDSWLFSIRDNGIGIEQEYEEKIFLLFKTLHNKTVYKGLGYGLAVSKLIIEKHKGDIWLLSELGKGSTFFFQIPKSEIPIRQVEE